VVDCADERETDRGGGCRAGDGPEAALTNKGKLVRDKIPQIIRAQGGEPIVRIAEAVEYRELLRAKLAEEVHEVLAADDADAPGELADVLEVVLALAADLGMNGRQLESLRAAKAAERGGFADRIVWSGNVVS
jgi:predicted house-cleaning noncanonical NTP pyrophosphatase (MazG superfamily)